ncbi:MAG TPA: hypothetical protein VHM19_21625 [Polyangiales bacterium]|jgi:hypothetical protein|nr:hypothetical protein [Polyangiales bacterium]
MSIFELNQRNVSLLALGIALAAPAAAHATPNFPDVVEKTVGTAGPPPCSLCHQGDVRNNYSVKTPFGQAVKARGLVPEDEGSLRSALKMLRDEKTDSDHDGVSDIDELVNGDDPNVPGDQMPGPHPTYGCSVGTPRSRERAGASLAWLGMTILVLGWRRRRRT